MSNPLMILSFTSDGGSVRSGETNARDDVRSEEFRLEARKTNAQPL